MTETPHPLVGRDRELDALERLLQESRAGVAHFLVVSGEPGIGKSSLIAALGHRAEATGCLALNGRATELERDFPFGLIVNALDAHLGSLDPRSFETHLRNIFAKLGVSSRVEVARLIAETTTNQRP